MIARAKKRKSPQLKEDKFHIIVNKKDKMLIDNAASILGLDVPAFMLESALKAAKNVFAKVDYHALSRDDLRVFLRLLTDPPAPNKAMKEIFSEYNKRIKNKV